MPTPQTAIRPKWGGHGYKVERAKECRREYVKRVAEMMQKFPGASPGEIDERIYTDNAGVAEYPVTTKQTR